MKSATKVSQTRALLLIFLMTIGLFSTSCGDGSSGRNMEIPGINGPTVTLSADNVLIAMVFENLIIDGGLRYQIPKYPNSYIEISPDFESGGTLMAVSVSLDDIFGGVNQLDPQKLPGGRNLPGVASGSLPAVAFSIEKFHNMAFYLGPKVFGIFVPIKKLSIGQTIITTRFYSNSSRVGNLSLVGEDENGENAGLLLMLTMSKSRVKRLKRIARKY